MDNKLKEDLETIENNDLAVRIASTQLDSEHRNKKYWLTDMKFTSETFILHGTPSEISADIYETPSEVMSVGMVMTVQEVMDFLYKHNYDFPKLSNVKLEFDGVSNEDDYWLCNSWDTKPTVEVNDDDIVIYGWVADKKANAVWSRHDNMYMPYSWLSKDNLIDLLERESVRDE